MGIADPLDNVTSLAELHEAITALRRRERVLSTLSPDAVMLDRREDAGAGGCFRIDRERLFGAGLLTTPAISPLRAPQPSPDASSFTRV